MAVDRRTFIKLDVGYFDNPKIQSLIDEHPRAVLLHAKCIAYARQHLTDGLVPLRVAMRSVAAGNADGIAACNAGLLTDVGNGNVMVHDYAEHQQTAEEVNSFSQAQSKKARVRWDAEGKASGNASGIADGNAEKRREELSSELRPDVLAILDHLDRCIVANGAKKPGRTKSNLAAARLLIDRDGKTVDEIHHVIDWATSDSFWKANILSASKLRDKFDQLAIKAATVKASTGRNLTEWEQGFAGRPRVVGGTEWEQ